MKHLLRVTATKEQHKDSKEIWIRAWFENETPKCAKVPMFTCPDKYKDETYNFGMFKARTLTDACGNMLEERNAPANRILPHPHIEYYHNNRLIGACVFHPSALNVPEVRIRVCKPVTMPPRFLILGASFTSQDYGPPMHPGTDPENGPPWGDKDNKTDVWIWELDACSGALEQKHRKVDADPGDYTPQKSQAGTIYTYDKEKEGGQEVTAHTDVSGDLLSPPPPAP